MNLLVQLPDWAHETLTWLLTGTNLASLFAILASIFKMNSTNKTNKSIGETQIGLLTVMTEKLADTKDLACNVQAVSNQMSEALLAFEKGLTEQREANAHLAVFIMECFNKSNLSDEAKAELQIMADKIFYNDNTKVMEALKTAKAKADEALAEGLEKIAKLEAELLEQKQKLALAQENVKESRRV